MQTFTPISIHEFPTDIKKTKIPLILKVDASVKGIDRLDRINEIITIWCSLRNFSIVLMSKEPIIKPTALQKKRKEYYVYNRPYASAR